MKITIIGSGVAVPSLRRLSPGLVAEAGGETLLFDCGPATTWKLVRNGIATTDIDTVVFTHHHFDHDADFPTFILTRWDRSTPKAKPLSARGS